MVSLGLKISNNNNNSKMSFIIYYYEIMILFFFSYLIKANWSHLSSNYLLFLLLLLLFIVVISLPSLYSMVLKRIFIKMRKQVNNIVNNTCICH